MESILSLNQHIEKLEDQISKLEEQNNKQQVLRIDDNAKYQKLKDKNKRLRQMNIKKQMKNKYKRCVSIDQIDLTIGIDELFQANEDQYTLEELEDLD